MFITSEELKNRIAKISSLVNEKTAGHVYYEEMIAIPCFGHIILRFNINQDQYTLDDLDYYESLLYECVKDEFLIDFMGEVYRKVGCDYSNQLEKYQAFASKYQDEASSEGKYALQIKEDAKILLKKANYDTFLDVWEIQVDEDELVLLLLGKENKVLKKEDKLIVATAEYRSCTGLFKALLYAKRNHISLGRLL